VAVTFDDAFACLIRNVLPVAEELGMPVTIFAVSSNLGDVPRWGMPDGRPEAREVTMSESELAEVARRPLCRVESHTATHQALAVLSVDQAFSELTDSKEALERIIGRPVRQIAAPHGSWSPEVADAARRAGYSAFLTLDQRLSPDPDRPWVMGRFVMTPDAWPIEFALTAAGAYGWVRGVRRIVRRVLGLFRGGSEGLATPMRAGS
jgi:peptidoglycan/xylan/chitin deacetylase (PgdA/CDA1 family)